MQFRRKIKKYVIAVILFILASYTTIFIKDAVDAINPEKSLPIISVSVGYNPPYVVRAGYTWHFGAKTVRSPYVASSDAPLVVTDCSPEEQIVITFSAPYEYITVYQAEGLANDEFVQMYTLSTPQKEGIYVYKIEAQFEKGDIVYYFAVQVKQANLIS